MSSQTALGHHLRAFLHAEASGAISARGLLIPRLSVELTLRTHREKVEAEIQYLRM